MVRRLLCGILAASAVAIMASTPCTSSGGVRFSADYIRENKGRVIFEVPEVLTMCMVKARGFIRFSEFAGELVRLYGASSDAKLTQVYPPLLDWCTRQ